MRKLVIFLIILFTISLLPNEASYTTDVLNKFAPLSLQHPLGTDNLGRDVADLMRYGFIRTVQTVFIASTFSLSLGLLAGFYAGYRGGLSLHIIEFVANLSLIVPSFIVALIISSLIGFNPISIGWALGVFDFGIYALQVATLTQRVMREDFITMAILSNVPARKIFVNHVFLHVFPAVSTLFASRASSIVLRYAALAFIGLGADITKPDWGMLLYEYRIYFLDHPLLLLMPTVAIFLFCLCVQLLFDVRQENKQI